MKKFLTPAPPQWAISGKKIVMSVSLGELHILVVAKTAGESESRVYSSGQSQYGQTGHGDQLQRHELTPVSCNTVFLGDFPSRSSETYQSFCPRFV